MATNFINVLGFSIIANFTLTLFIFRSVLVLLFLSLVAFYIVSHQLRCLTVIFHAFWRLVVKISTGTEIVLHSRFTMRAVIYDCLTLIHCLLIESIPAFFAIYHKVRSAAVVTNSIRSHIFSQNIKTNIGTAIRAFAVFEKNVTVFAVDWIKKVKILSTERDPTSRTRQVFPPNFAFATANSLSYFQFVQMKLRLLTARTNRINQISATPALIAGKTLENNCVLVYWYFSSTRTSNRFILKLTLLASYCLTHSVTVLVFEEKFTTRIIWTAEKECTVITVVAVDLLAIIWFLQYHSFLRGIAMRAESQSPIDIATFLVTYMCAESFS